MGKPVEDVMLRIGRGLRRLVEGLENSARAAGDAVTGEQSATPKIERTADGLYRIGGFLFTSEAQDFAERRERRLASSAPVSVSIPAPAASPALTVQRPPSASVKPVPAAPEPPSISAEQEFMALHGVEPVASGGFRAGGYIFSTFDQAASWAKRRNSSTPQSGPRLMSHANTGGIQLPNDPSIAPSQLKRMFSGMLAPTEPLDEPASSSSSSAIRWLSEPTTIGIAGVSVTTDMVYVGKVDRYEYGHNSVIDPSLKVASTGDPYGQTLGYWSRYRDLDPKARRTYLDWLQGDRNDPTVPIGLVFVFFYGLEHRLLKEGVHDEAPKILSEVRRLHSLFVDHSSFDRYAKALIEVAELITREGIAELEPTLELGMHWEMPIKVRVALGSKVADGVPLHADDALTWILATEGTYLRTPAQRCFAELRELWGRRFAAAYPNGFKVTPPKARITHHYRAASSTFSVDLSIDGLPDVCTLQAPVKRFRTMLDTCVEDLDAYSRFLGRNPDKKGSIAAAILLPADLRDGEAGKQLRAVRDSLVAFVEGDPPTVSAVLELLDLDVPGPGERMPLATVRQMASTLDVLDVGFEPDRRYGASSSLAAETKIELFACEGGGKVEPDAPAYVAARTMAEIAALAAVSDGMVVPVELDAICRDLRSLPGLGEVERQRLAAHAASLLNDPPKRKEAIKRLSGLPQPLRQRILQSAVGAILADGRVLPAEVRFLEGLHTALGLPQEDVYALLHRASVSDDDQLVTIATEERTPGVPLPKEFIEGATVLRIDTGRLERIRNETLEVSGLLADIFVEDVEIAAAAPVIVAASRFERLDPAHADLLWRVVFQPVPVEEFEVHARSVKLLPDGAVETINEWGFDTFDETVIALEDMVYVHEHLVEQLRVMGEQA